MKWDAQDKCDTLGKVGKRDKEYKIAKGKGVPEEDCVESWQGDQKDKKPDVRPIAELPCKTVLTWEVELDLNNLDKLRDVVF